MAGQGGAGQGLARLGTAWHGKGTYGAFFT
jgi:hypothetical protein